MILVRLAAILTLCGACISGGIPQATPGEMGDFVAALVVRGAAITDQVAGDTGCSEPTLIGNAVRLDVRMPAESASSPVYVFRWRRQADFDAAGASFAACVADFTQRSGAVSVYQFSDSLWRAFGRDWSPALRDAVAAAIDEAGGA